MLKYVFIFFIMSWSEVYRTLGQFLLFLNKCIINKHDVIKDRDFFP